MNAAEINREFDLLALAGADAHLRRSGAYFVGPCPFCGGTDRFCVKITPRGYRWFCRKCGDGRYHTAIDYVMRRDSVSFAEALTVLGGERRERAAPRPRAAAPRPGISLPDAAWQADALRDADAASEQLLTGEDPAGRDYLSHRGLRRGTWLAWGLGYASVYDPAVKHPRPAIVLPWLDSDPDQDAVTAVKYRFIDDEAGGLRYVSRRGSVPILYGLWAAVAGHRTLLLVEGEFNALSVWQCMPQGVTCLSFGSETGGRAQVLRAAARDHARVFIWADDPQRALALRQACGRRAVPLQSPVRGGTKLDANALLQHGLLMEFLSRLLDVECMGSP